jgi:uncharacterized membrane protein YfcA
MLTSTKEGKFVESIFLILIGIIASICGSIVGLGGGFIIVPFLAMFYKMPVSQIVGTSMAVLMFSSISSVLEFTKQKRIDYKSGFMYSIAMFPGSILGARITNFVSNKVFFIALGIFLLLMALFLLFKPNKKQENFLYPSVTRTLIDGSGQEFTYSFNLWFGIAVAFVAGFLSSLFGIGGGSVMVPTMVLLLSFPAHIAAATSMLSILLSSIVGTVSHMSFGHVVWNKVWFLAAGALIGGQLGAKIASKVPAKAILRVLSLCLMFVAIRLMFKG